MKRPGALANRTVVLTMDDLPGSGSDLAATNRRNLTAQSFGKHSRWPRTDRRIARARSVLQKRQPDLTVVLENILDPHNVAAVLRSCDAVGVQTVHVVDSSEKTLEKPFSRLSSASAAKWLEIVRHESVAACYSGLQEAGFRIVVTALTGTSRGLYDVSFTEPIAIVFGSENSGASPEAIAQADESLTIPMNGMVESLNISVSCAVVLYEALRQRQAAGMYQTKPADGDQFELLLADWLNR